MFWLLAPRMQNKIFLTFLPNDALTRHLSIDDCIKENRQHLDTVRPPTGRRDDSEVLLNVGEYSNKQLRVGQVRESESLEHHPRGP
jgi:hypothetical protein